MSLQEKLSAFKTQFESGQPPFDGVPPAVHEIMKRATNELIASGAADRVLRSGPAPDFDLHDAHGERIRLTDLLASGPVVVTFYRGVWCSYCNIDLEALEQQADAIRGFGASLVTITPQTAANSRKSINDKNLSFPLLSDPGNAVAELYGLRFRLPDYLIEVYKQLGVDLPTINGDASWTLPQPARFVVDAQGQIRHAEAHPDYTRRPDPETLLPILEALKTAAVA